MIDAQSPLNRRQASLLGIPTSNTLDTLTAAETGLNTVSIRQRLIDRGYSSKRLDRLIKNFGEDASSSGVDRVDAWVHVTHYLALAEIAFDSPGKAAHWLQRNTVHIDGATGAPITMLATREGSCQVEERLQQIRYGMYV